MRSKIYTVSYDQSSKSTAKYGKKGIPFLRFTGLWLTKHVGLKVGDKVLVLATAGKIAVLAIPNDKGKR
jgi:hypothetical protein